MVHMDDRDLLFVCRDKTYVAYFLDWLVSDDQRKEELHTGLTTYHSGEGEYGLKQGRAPSTGGR
jgi:hypothetical protein